MESTNSTLTLTKDLLHQRHHLKEAVSIAVKEDCDLFIVSKDKKIFPCQRSLLVLYSPLIASILSDLPCCLSPTIFLPHFQEQHIRRFLHLLGSGQTIAGQNVNADIKSIAKIAEVLQVSMTDINIGSYQDNPLGVPFQIKKEEIKEEVEELTVKQKTKSLSEKYNELVQSEEDEYIEDDSYEMTYSCGNIKREETDTAHSKVPLMMESNSGSSTNEKDNIEVNYEAPDLKETGTISEEKERQEETIEFSVQVPGKTAYESNDDEQEGKSRENSDRLCLISAVTSLSQSTIIDRNLFTSQVPRRESSPVTPTQRSKLGDLIDTCNKSDSKGYRDQSQMTVKIMKGDTSIGYKFGGENNEGRQWYEEGGEFMESTDSVSKDETGLNEHEQIYTGEKLHVCSYCQKGFKNPSGLKRHIRTHTGEKPFHCDICIWKFATSYDLKKHTTRIHTGEKPFQCTICPKKFATSSDLKRHTRIHTGELFHCEICPKKFPTSHDLKRHTRIHTGEKPFQCTICLKKFATSSELKSHTRIHTGEKPFQCTICLKKFARNETLTEHKKNCNVKH